MPFQNRVDPWGELHAVDDRGSWLGNRGILHDEQQRITSPWKHKAWVTCELQFKDRQREIFSPHSYSELFFLDEVTALSAGHRPCAECRRARFNEFKAAWLASNRSVLSTSKVSISDIDKVLHAERAWRAGNKVTFQKRLDALPSGTMFVLGGMPHLLWDKRIAVWSFSGYQKTPAAPEHNAVIVDVLTPRSIVNMYADRFRPQVHSSVNTE